MGYFGTLVEVLSRRNPLVGRRFLHGEWRRNTKPAFQLSPTMMNNKNTLPWLMKNSTWRTQHPLPGTEMKPYLRISRAWFGTVIDSTAVEVETVDEVKKEKKKKTKENKKVREVKLKGFERVRDLIRKAKIDETAVAAYFRRKGFPMTRKEMMKKGVLSFDEAKQLLETLRISAIYEEVEINKGDRIETKETLSQMVNRPPVVVVMGHVDHGKTTLLDALRNTSVAAGEAGGITQELSAFQISLIQPASAILSSSSSSFSSPPSSPSSSLVMTFLDTPGHSAFRNMRRNGSYVADIALVVIAIDEGVQPQTIEAIRIAKEEQTPIVVALNKIDLFSSDSTSSSSSSSSTAASAPCSSSSPDSKSTNISSATTLRVEEVKKQLLEKCRLRLVRPGDENVVTTASPASRRRPFQSQSNKEVGVTKCPYVEISAKQRLHLPNLIQLLVEKTKTLDLTSDIGTDGVGTVLEVFQSKKQGMVLKVLVHSGTFKVGQLFVSAISSGRIRRIYERKREARVIGSFNSSSSSLDKETEVEVEEATPGMPIEIVGLRKPALSMIDEGEDMVESLPFPGDGIFIVPALDRQEEILHFRRLQSLHEQQLAYREQMKEAEITQEDGIEEEPTFQGGPVSLAALLKADTKGSLEMLLEEIRLKNKKHKSLLPEVRVVRASLGDVVERDLKMSSAASEVKGSAPIFCLRTKMSSTSQARELQQKEGIPVFTFDVFQDLLDSLEKWRETQSKKNG